MKFFFEDCKNPALWATIFAHIWRNFDQSENSKRFNSKNQSARRSDVTHVAHLEKNLVP